VATVGTHAFIVPTNSAADKFKQRKPALRGHHLPGPARSDGLQLAPAGVNSSRSPW
jgi:hypothetical protein